MLEIYLFCCHKLILIMEKSKIALITGATSGIGKATAYRLAKMAYNLIITGRREERLLEIKGELENLYKIKVLPLVFDIQSNKEVEEALSLSEEWKNIDVLVNNAGLALGLDGIQDGDLSDWEQMIDTNVKGLLYVTRVVAPWMIKNKKGHIFNIGSIAGKEVYPKGNVYCATKHAVDALTKAMRIDMVEHGIKVTQIAPGAVETEFSLVRFHQDSEKAKNVYNGYTPLTGDDIAACIESVLNLPSNICIGDMLVLPMAQASSRDYKK